MADVTVSAHVWPSANDLAGANPAGWGRTAYEKNLAGSWIGNLRGQNNYVISGGTMSSGSGLTLVVAAVSALIDGHHVNVASSTNVTLPASSTSYLFVKLLKDGNGNVSSVAIEHNTTGTVPSDCVELGSVVTNASAITTITDNRAVYGTAKVWTSSGTWRVPGGIVSVIGEVYGPGGGGGGGGGGGSATGYGGSSPGQSGSPGVSGLSGGYATGRLSVTGGASHTITIGSGGSGGSGGGGGGGGGSAGASGGTTSLGSLLSATGGGGGAGGCGGSNGSGLGGGKGGGATGGPGSGAGGDLQLTGGGAGGGAGGGGGGGGGGGAGGGGEAGAAGTAGGNGRVVVWYL